MNITIIGASGGIGLETVKRGLNRKHTITTLSRSEIIIEENNSLKIIMGDATHKADLLKSIQNACKCTLKIFYNRLPSSQINLTIAA